LLTSNQIRVALDAHSVGQRQTGNETYALNLADALARRPDVDLLVLQHKGVAWSSHHQAKMVPLLARSPLFRIPIELPIRAWREHADLLHVQYVAPPISPVPVVTMIHDISFEDVPGLFRRGTELRLRTLVPFAARRSRVVLTVSEFSRTRLIERYGLEPARVFVTANGVGPSWRVLDGGERQKRLATLALPESFVLAVGNLHPRKNIVRLIKAVKSLRGGGIGDLHLVLAGQRGWRAEDIDRAVAQADAMRWVHELGYVSNRILEALYGQARAVAYPSIYEGFGLPALEALASGAVLVTSATTSIPEVVGDAAVLVDPTDEHAIAQGLARAVTDEELRVRLIQKGPAQAARFTWERCAEETVAAYHAALRRS
jgi:glycosyltransferase involved in cell wall biosynthesis